MQRRAEVPELPAISDEALNRAMHLVTPDGRVYRGGRAVPQILRYVPGGFLLRPFFWIPGVPAVTDRVYDYIAARRHSLGCGSDSCSFTP